MEIINARELITSSEKILIFTGAGMSQESGIPTFRDLNGIWKKYNPLIWATKTGLFFNYIIRRKKFANFIIDIGECIATAKPHEGHFAISSIQKSKTTFILTQNIDNLHQDAGSVNVHEIHGNIFERRHNGKVTEKIEKTEFSNIIHELKKAKTRRSIKKGLNHIINFYNSVRPNVVLFNEPINIKSYDEAIDFAKSCDCLIVVGTSLRVYPAAEIVNEVSSCRIINIGYESIPNAINIVGNASKIINNLFN